MQTPGHAVINVALLGGALGASPGVLAGLVLGAVLPDVPIVILYGYQRLVHGTPEEEIWAVHYQKRLWLNLVHGAHSLPIAAAGALVCLALNVPEGVAFFASMFGHALFDLPVHARDAHRHFLPISQYRFESPLSYWDPAFHGAKVALFEALLVLTLSGVIVLRGVSAWGVGVLTLVNLAYAVHYAHTFLRRGAQVRQP